MAETQPAQLSPSDSLMWHIERDPVLRSPILAVGLLDREPEWSGVRETFERAVVNVPRLRQVIVAPEWGIGRLQWRDDDAFSLDYHLRQVRAPHPGSLRSVLELAAPSATSALDPARPLWECTLVGGLEGGRAAFVLKFHHTITDGVGGVDLASVIFDASRGGRAATVPERPEPPPGPSVLAQVSAAARQGIGMAMQPRRTSAELVRFAKSLGRMLEPVPSPLSPVFVGRGLDRQLDVIELPLAGLRAAADHADGTINDVFLAAIAGGLHDFHGRLGHAVPALRVTMPISLRDADDPAGGNHFTPARFVLPIDDPDPVARAHIAGAIARRWRAEPAVGMTDILAALIDRLPPAMATKLFASMLRNVDVDAVDVPGLRRPAYLGGAAIERMWAFAPPTGAALSITLLSHLDTCCVGVLTDLAAVADPELLLTCLEQGFEEVLSVGAPHASTVTRLGA